MRAIVNTGDDMWLAGLRITPDLDSIMYALAGVNDTERGWGRVGETERVSAELAAWGVGWPWFTLGDLDLGTHISRTVVAARGRPAEHGGRAADRALAARGAAAAGDRWEVETHVVVADEDGGERELHFQEWWTRYRAALPALRFEKHGLEHAVARARRARRHRRRRPHRARALEPGRLDRDRRRHPRHPDALRAAAAPIVGVSPIIGGAVVRGMADACLTAIGVETSAGAVARHYGARSDGGLLDAWLVDDVDAGVVDELRAAGIEARAVPLWMRDEASSAALAAAVIEAGLGRS